MTLSEDSIGQRKKKKNTFRWNILDLFWRDPLSGCAQKKNQGKKEKETDDEEDACGTFLGDRHKDHQLIIEQYT